MGKSKEFRYKRIGIASAVILVILIFGYFNPTLETITCDENLTCRIERTYYWNHSSHSTIKLSTNSYMYGTLYERRGRRHRYYYISPVILDKDFNRVQPFRSFYKSVPSGMRYEAQDNPDIVIKKEIKNFKKYLKNPNLGFSISTDYGEGNILAWAFFIIAGLIIYLVGTFAERTAKKTRY